MEPMVDPVLDTEGNSYERSAIRQWLRQSRTSPLSRQPLTERMLVPNVALKSVIHEIMGEVWVKEQQQQLLQQQAMLQAEDSGRSSVVTTASTSQARTRSQHAAAPGAGGLLHQQHSNNHNNHNSNNFRAKIDCFLQHTCRELGGLQLQLNEDGCCAFRYENITVVLDVPATAGVFCLYTKHLVDLDVTSGCTITTTTNQHRNDLLCRRALALNFLQGDTRGGCLSIRSKESGCDEIMFSYTDRVPEVSARDFSNILLNFVETSVVLREKLLKAPMDDTSATIVGRPRGPTNIGGAIV
jgi:U-box domain